MSVECVFENETCILYDELWSPQGLLFDDEKIVKLLKSNVINRLKNIGQNGPSYHITPPISRIEAPIKTTRFDHSCGTMIITKIFGGTTEEQLSALLHDIPHTCFSHTVDFMVGKPEESYHEVHKDEILVPYEPELKEILGKKWKNFLDGSKFPVVKLNRHIASDVVDYLCRDAFTFNQKPREELVEYGQKLIIKPISYEEQEETKNRRLCCNNQEEAVWWQNLSKLIGNNIYNAPWSIGQNIMLAKILEEKNILEEIITCKLNEKNYITDEDIQRITRVEWKFGDSISDKQNWKKEKDINIRTRIANPFIVKNGLAVLDPKIEKNALDISESLKSGKELYYHDNLSGGKFNYYYKYNKYKTKYMKLKHTYS